MEDVILGILAILIGLTFSFFGYVAMRLIIPIWGALAGFALGAGLVSSFGDDGFLRTGLSWVLGIVFALVFALFAYFYYAISVVIAMGAIGFAIGSSVVVALNIDWNWVSVLVGIAVGVLFAFVAIVTDLPALLLIILSAFAGAAAVTFGTMLLFGATNTSDYSGTAVANPVDDDWWWYALYFVVAIAGMVSQIAQTSSLTASLRESWGAPRSSSAADAM